MKRDPLASLIRLRRAACDDAQRSLVSCLNAETSAEAGVTEAERAIARETEAATDLAGSDAAVEAFVSWLPEGRRRAENARLALERLQADTARARASLTACRTALETVETLHAQRQQALQLEEQRRCQLELDECAHSAGAGGPD